MGVAIHVHLFGVYFQSYTKVHRGLLLLVTMLYMETHTKGMGGREEGVAEEL